jgi:hypothetical protein
MVKCGVLFEVRTEFFVFGTETCHHMRQYYMCRYFPILIIIEKDGTSRVLITLYLVYQMAGHDARVLSADY